MTELETNTRRADDILSVVFRLSEEQKLTDKDYLDIIDTLKRISLVTNKIINNFEKPIKETLKFNEKVEFENRIYFYKTTTAKTFDNEKAKKTLRDLDFVLEDFEKLQTRKTLISEIKK